MFRRSPAAAARAATSVAAAIAPLAAVCALALGSALVALLGCATAWAAPNKLPTVALTAPANGATFTAPATIALTASASDPDGTIAKVDFLQGTTLIGTRTASPYTLTWSNVPGGTYSLTARATDDRGGVKTSTAVAVTVTGAKVAILTPANGATVYGDNVTVGGTFAGDANTTVLVDNGSTTRVATIDGSAFTATMPLHVGPNTLRVVASRRDRTWDEATVVVTGNGNPLLVFTEPALTVFEAPATVELAVDALSPAAGIARVDFLRNGMPVGSATAPPYRHTLSALAAGNHTIGAVATDTLGVSGSTSLAITVAAANVAPAVSLTSPANGAVYTAPASIAMGASASDSDGTVALVEFLRNGAVVGSTNVAPYTITWNDVAAGTYVLAARATDNRSVATTSAPVSVTVVPPNSPPAIALTSPVAGATFVAPATIVLSATASDADGTIAKVEFSAGAMLVGTVTAAPYSVTWSGVAAGSHTITARATDNAGAATTSVPVSITVQSNQPPTVTLTSPPAGATPFAPATITFAATAADPDGSVVRVDFLAGTTMVGSVTSLPYTFTWTDVAAGTYPLTAKAVDNVGAVATSAPVTLTVGAPAFTIQSPVDGATIAADTVTVSGTVSAPGNSGLTVNGIVAAIAGGHFYATGVPLATGANAVDVTLTTLAGHAATQTITVTSTGPAPVQVTASPAQGLAPLEVVFTATSLEDTAITKVEVDADGDGTWDKTQLAEPWSTSVTYAGSGTAMATVRVTDAQGAVHTETLPIVIVDAAALDQDLRAVWSGMTAALAAGDKTSALRYLDANAQRKYDRVFDVLLPQMPQIVASFSPLKSVTLSNGLGEYAVNRIIDGVNRLFFVYFVRNGDGVWRLGSM
jgi:hypothetical protein